MNHSLSYFERSLAGASNLEELTRPILVLLQRITGLDSVYLTVIDEPGGVQKILFSENAGKINIEEGASVPWEDTLCKRALAEGRYYTKDVPGTWGDSSAARQLGLRTYLTVPVRGSRNTTFGTLCGASDRAVDIGAETMAVLELCSELIAQQLEREAQSRHAVVRARDAEERLESLALVSSIGDLCFRSSELEPALEESASILEKKGNWAKTIPFVMNGPQPTLLNTDDKSYETLTALADMRFPLALHREEGEHPDPVFDINHEDDPLKAAWQETDLPQNGDLALVSAETDAGRVGGVLLVSPAALDERASENRLLVNCSNYLSLLAERSEYLHRMEQANAELAIYAMHDPLTGLANRRYLVEELARMLANARRHGGRVLVAFIDLDGFKKINDKHGHETGDHFLQAMAGCLTSVARSGDIVSRYGGDEFVVVSPAGPAEVYDQSLRCFLLRIGNATEGRFELPGLTLDYGGASVGGVSSDERETDPDSLLAKADEAMYREKSRRKQSQDYQR